MLSKSRVKYIQSLYHKKLRDEEGCFVVEGPKITEEFLLHAPDAILSLYAVKSWLNDNEALIKRVDSSGVFLIEEGDLKKISSRSTPNQVLAIVKKREERHEVPAPPGIFLMLDSIQDPGNFGTIVRIADWFGISSILCSKSCADLYNPKVVQSTMGSLLRVDVVYTELTDWCKQNTGIAIYAATLHGKPVYECSPVQNGALLMGNESKGIQPELLRFCKEQLTIPRKGKAESLNAAVATGILLSHLVKQG
ncbi:RNA methyltransferase [Agriterribacter sp.]|uniref:TrmH family RNA methyltransferase n=1 Tax=Agriterribacter sp. TaxID=2821509 RepID=UPI002C2DF681|nr:RNA methyltransferase [Agriterribacter sp.]HRP54892.1 RNA methyltransferase [Agriterribacter sp.]